MKVYNWDEVEKEDMNELLGRQFISGSQITLARIFLKKGCIVPTHSHESEQMSTVFTGSLKFTVGGKEIVVGPGETLVIPSFVPHSAEAIEDCYEMDVFSPIRKDWIDGTDTYLRGGQK